VTIHEDSHAGTPEDSDEEDMGDLDEVVEFNSAYDDQPGSPRLGKPRSRQGSYADLQRLRMTPTEGESKTVNFPNPSRSVEIDGSCLRQAPRVRRHSLSDGVSVERIAAVNPQANFEDATHEINHELHPERPE
jgi:glycerol-3-phosphate O-acyltransferase/dihydroxyacetone phosphate acyltransferase